MQRLTLHATSALTTYRENYRASDINSAYMCALVCAIHFKVSFHSTWKKGEKIERFICKIQSELCHPSILKNYFLLLSSVKRLFTYLGGPWFTKTAFELDQYKITLPVSPHIAGFTDKLSGKPTKTLDKNAKCL